MTASTLAVPSSSRDLLPEFEHEDDHPPPRASADTSPPTYLEAAASGGSFACLLFLSDDLVRGFHFPSAVIDVIHSTLLKGWKGVYTKRNITDGVVEWKLEAKPWDADVPLGASYRLLEYLLLTLSKHGWHLMTSGSMFARGRPRDGFFFRPGPPRERLFFSVVFGRDYMLLVDAPSDAVRSAFIQATQQWPPGTGTPVNSQHGVTQVVMKRLSRSSTDAFSPSGTASMYAIQEEHAVASLMCTIFALFEACGYECVMAADALYRGANHHWDPVKGIISGPSPSVDAWIFATR